MKLLFDFFPILLFFIAYNFYGIYAATIVAMIASLLQVGVSWFKYRKIELTHIIGSILILVLGTATLLLRSTIFIKWKPTAVYWVLGLLFLGSQIIGAKPFIQRMLGNKITMPQNVWQRINFSWALLYAM